ncbi:trypsin-like peptidase domain-containing protein, partial [Aetokthonos hydrillicola]
MKSKLFKIGATTILTSVISVIGIENVLSYQLPNITRNNNEFQSNLLNENTKKLQSKIIIAKKSEDQNRTRLYEKASPAVVAIATGFGHGSGFIVSADGLVLTNAHVVQDGPKTVAIVLADGR